MKSAAENLARHMPVSSLLEVILQHCNGGSSLLSCSWADALALLCLDRSTFLTVSLYPLDTLEILLVDSKPSCYGIHGYGLSLGLRIKDSRYHCLACETLCKPANIFLAKKISQGVAAFPLTDLFYHHHGNNHRHYHSNGNSVTVVVSLIGKLVSLDNPRVLVET